MLIIQFRRIKEIQLTHCARVGIVLDRMSRSAGDEATVGTASSNADDQQLNLSQDESSDSEPAPLPPPRPRRGQNTSNGQPDLTYLKATISRRLFDVVRLKYPKQFRE